MIRHLLAHRRAPAAIATKEQARASFEKWLMHNWFPTMNRLQVESTANRLADVFEELVGRRATPVFTDRIHHDLDGRANA